MKITDLMSKEAIKIHGHASSKMDAIDQMVSLMNKQGNVSDKEAYKEAVIERENLSTTGMVDGIAIPHARTTAITQAGIAAMTLPEGVDYQSMDGQPTTLIFLIGAPASRRLLKLIPTPPPILESWRAELIVRPMVFMSSVV